MKIIECPRDAMQGLEDFIPTEKKVLMVHINDYRLNFSFTLSYLLLSNENY